MLNFLYFLFLFMFLENNNDTFLFLLGQVGVYNFSPTEIAFLSQYEFTTENLLLKEKYVALEEEFEVLIKEEGINISLEGIDIDRSDENISFELLKRARMYQHCQKLYNNEIEILRENMINFINENSDEQVNNGLSESFIEFMRERGYEPELPGVTRGPELPVVVGVTKEPELEKLPGVEDVMRDFFITSEDPSVRDKASEAYFGQDFDNNFLAWLDKEDLNSNLNVEKTDTYEEVIIVEENEQCFLSLLWLNSFYISSFFIAIGILLLLIYIYYYYEETIISFFNEIYEFLFSFFS